jgi:hypothetical protein
LKVLRPKSVVVSPVSCIPELINATNRGGKTGEVQRLKNLVQRLKTSNYTEGQLHNKNKKDVRKSRGDLIAQRNIFLNSTSAEYQTLC